MYATTIMVFFAHLLILEYPDHCQHFISSSLYYPGPLHKISHQSIHNFLSNIVHRQTNKQTNATKNITSFANEAMIKHSFLIYHSMCQQVMCSIIVSILLSQLNFLFYLFIPYSISTTSFSTTKISVRKKAENLVQ